MFKFSLDIFVQLESFKLAKGDPYYFFPKLVASLYSFFWDVYVCWGLLRSSKKATYGLRDKILYPAKAYYFAVVSDFVLRLIWLTGYINEQYIDMVFFDKAIYDFFLAILEGVRRLIWTIFRTENENINNFEKYRNILEIPKMRDEEDVLEEEYYIQKKKKK